MAIIKSAGAVPAAVLIGLNRQEKGQGALSAIQEVEEAFGIPVVSIIKLDHIIDYLESAGGQDSMVGAIKAYRAEFGV
jgi:orotate phosphoribosyltransferase